jgi:hypothetical protein
VVADTRFRHGALVAGHQTLASDFARNAQVEHTSWELPVRLLARLTILVGLTQIALCGATHRRFGPTGPRQFLWGLLISLPGSRTFSLAVAVLAPSIDRYLALSIALGLTVPVAAWRSRNLWSAKHQIVDSTERASVG